MTSLFALITVVGLVVTALGIVVQLYHARLLAGDQRLLRDEAPPEALALIQLRIGIAAILGIIQLLVAAAAVAHIASHSPVRPVGADYWDAVVRVAVPALVLLSTVLSVNFRQRLLRRE